VITVTRDSHLDVGGIARRHLGLRHEEGRADLALEQRVEPLPLLRLTAVLGYHLHVARVWSSTVDGLRRYPALAQVLCHEPVLEVAEASTLPEVCLGQKHIPQPELLRPLLHVLDNGWVGREALLYRLADLACVYGIGGDAFFFDEPLYLLIVRH